MDFLDPNKKRAHIRRIYIGYFLMGIAILLSAFILVYISYGYKLDSQTGNIVQNGLIFINSGPESSSIFLNGKANGSTEKRLTVPEGKYDIELRRDGYDSWKKTIQLSGSSIERLIYPKLFPSELKTSQVKSYDTNPAFSTQSLDRKWVIISQPNSITKFDIFDTSNPSDPVESFELPTSLYTSAQKANSDKLELIEWSSDNKNFLVKHYYDNKAEYVLINREEPAKSLNLNKFYKLTPKSITLRDKKADQFYIWKTDLSVSSANTKSTNLTPVLANATSFQPHQQNILIYGTVDPDNPDSTMLRIRDNNKDYDVREFPKSKLLLDIVKFDGHWYASAISPTEGRLYIYKDFVQKVDGKRKNALVPYNILKLDNPVELSFSANTRFVMAQSRKGVAIYDLEEDERHNFDFKEQLLKGQLATWMDGHRITVNRDNMLEVFEFDNQNRRTLVAITANSLPFFDRDYERLFTLAKAEPDSKTKTTNLNKTFLKLNLED